MKELHLTLIYLWYDMIEAGIKNEEYRKIKPYWVKRLLLEEDVREFDVFAPLDNEAADYFSKHIKALINGLDINVLKVKPYTHVTFHRGYTKTKMTFKIKNITIGYGLQGQGAPENEPVFIIKLGKRIK